MPRKVHRRGKSKAWVTQGPNPEEPQTQRILHACTFDLEKYILSDSRNTQQQLCYKHQKSSYRFRENEHRNYSRLQITWHPSLPRAASSRSWHASRNTLGEYGRLVTTSKLRVRKMQRNSRRFVRFIGLSSKKRCQAIQALRPGPTTSTRFRQRTPRALSTSPAS